MAGATVAFIFFIAIANGALGWTIDLPEVRKYFFEKYNHDKGQVETKTQLKPNETFYDNIKPDSPYNKEYYYKKKHYEEPFYEHGERQYENDVRDGHADEYEHEAYMEKKVAEAVHNGSQYLEGLGRSLRRFAERLENCSRTDFSGVTFNQSQPFNSSMPTGTNQPMFSNQNQSLPAQSNTTNSTWLPENEQPMPQNLTDLDREYMSCERATKASEHVRRLAQLALWATKELQDKAYDEKYGEHSHEKEQEKNELVLRLAWFLDRLAALSGYDPADDEFTPLMDGKELHDPASLIAGVTSTPELITSSWFSRIKPSYPDMGVMPIETLQLSETVNPIVTLTVDEPVKSIRKRSAENPLMDLVKYYTKYKAWTNENPSERLNKDDLFAGSAEEDNSLTAVKIRRERSIENKKGKVLLPEDPMQDISQYVKHRGGVNYVKDENQAEKIRLFLEKIRLHSQSGKKNMKKLEKKIRSLKKRSITYGNKHQPMISDDPMQDIGYYIRNKPGTNIRPNIENAALVRAGLEQAFQQPNIMTVRRYASNYNPAIPSPLLAAIMESYADINS